MPNYKGHLAGGAVVYAIALICVTAITMPRIPLLSSMIEWLFFALVGSLFPDIDTKSKIQKYFYATILVVLCFLIVCDKKLLFMTITIISLLPLLATHRGLFHRTWFIVGLSAMASYWLCLCFPAHALSIKYDLFFFVSGALSHLWLDLGWYRMLRI